MITADFRFLQVVISPIQNHRSRRCSLGRFRVHGELLKLGFEVSERTVSRCRSDGKNHPNLEDFSKIIPDGQLVSIDFFTIPTLQLRVLFVFVVLAHQRRRVLHLDVTEDPTAEWTAQQIIESFPEGTALSTHEIRQWLQAWSDGRETLENISR